MPSPSERLRFEETVRSAAIFGHDAVSIGTYKEKSLHYLSLIHI